MKYSLLALLFVMSILAYADYDLDKPATISMGSSLRVEKYSGTQYLNNLSIKTLVEFLVGEVALGTGNGYTSELESDEILTGDNSKKKENGKDGGTHWDNHWDDKAFSNFTNNTTEETVNNLVSALNNYKNNFSSIMQLYDATISNGCTSSLNNATGTLSASTTPTESSNSLKNTPGINLVIYAGRNTTSENTNLNRNMTIATSGRVYHIYSYETSTPIVLDLDGDGNLEASKGQHLPHSLCVPESELVAFDINADGFEELVEWVGANDGLLVHDIVNNEVSGKNLFGDATGFKNGFEQLATLDANKDGALTGEELAGLSVWQDKNRNAKIDAGEIHSLESLGITKLNVEAIELTATFERNGKYYKMWDWNPVTIMVKKAK